MERQWVGFDIDAIQDYVFGGSRPIDIQGASLIVEKFGDRAQQLAREAGAQTIYCGGGNGLFRLDGPTDRAATLAAQLEQEFTDATRGAGTCSAASVSAADTAPLPEVMATLGTRLRRRKSVRWLDVPGEVLAQVSSNQELCQGCGAEAGTVQDRLSSRDEEPEYELIGPQCQARRNEARSARKDRSNVAAHDLNEIFDRESELLAAVYLDADRAGELFATVDSADQLTFLADIVREGSSNALHRTVGDLGLEGRVVHPVVGGDDVLVLCAAREAARLVERLWGHLDTEVAALVAERFGRPLSFSAGVAIGDRFVPLRVFYDRAAAALRAAKTAGVAGGTNHTGAHVVVETIGRPRRTAPEQSPLFGGAVTAAAWRGWSDSSDGGPSIARVVRDLAGVSSAQRAALLDDLATPSPSVREIDIEYRAVQHGADRSGVALQDALVHADGVASSIGGDRWAVLRGGLFAVDLGWTDV